MEIAADVRPTVRSDEAQGVLVQWAGEAPDALQRRLTQALGALPVKTYVLPHRRL